MSRNLGVLPPSEPLQHRKSYKEVSVVECLFIAYWQNFHRKLSPSLRGMVEFEMRIEGSGIYTCWSFLHFFTKSEFVGIFHPLPPPAGEIHTNKSISIINSCHKAKRQAVPFSERVGRALLIDQNIKPQPKKEEQHVGREYYCISNTFLFTGNGMDTIYQNEPINDFENIECLQWIKSSSR